MTAEQLRAWKENWRVAAERIQELEDAEIRLTNTAAAISSFDSAFRGARASCPPKETSGLVELQRRLRGGRPE